MHYSQSPTGETSPVGDRIVFYDNASRKAVVLNPTGAWLCQQLSTRLSVDELVQKLRARFASVDATQIRADVEKCLCDPTQQQLLREEA